MTNLVWNANEESPVDLFHKVICAALHAGMTPGIVAHVMAAAIAEMVDCYHGGDPVEHQDKVLERFAEAGRERMAMLQADRIRNRGERLQ